MIRVILIIVTLCCVLSSISYASERVPMTVQIQEIAGSGRGGEPLKYGMSLKQGNKVVVSMNSEAEGNSLPKAQTFSARYCGAPVQVVVFRSELVPSACGHVTRPGIGHGAFWQFLIYKRDGWVLMDELDQADTKDCATGQWMSHDDGKRTIALLQSGRFPCQKPTQHVNDQALTPVARADCSKAHTTSEKAICTNPKLQALDSQLAQAYHQAFGRTQPKSSQRMTLIRDQRTWLQSVNACQGGLSCLQKIYGERIQGLQADK